jgi:hypothetical protein
MPSPQCASNTKRGAPPLSNLGARELETREALSVGWRSFLHEVMRGDCSARRAPASQGRAVALRVEPLSRHIVSPLRAAIPHAAHRAPPR